MDWEAFWSEFPASLDATDFCRQVGRTSNGGVPTPREELEVLVDGAAGVVGLRADSALLDLCCGNGLLTRMLSPRCSRIVGVDYSQPLLELARSHQAASNIEYLCGSALDLPALLDERRGFDRMIMFESLQYFKDIGPLLDSLGEVMTPSHRLLFTGVLDRTRLWSFYDTPERREEYERRLREGTEKMGFWYEPDELRRAGEAMGYNVNVLDQDTRLNTSHYRFDLLLEK